ncbi:hypothetical protein HK104_006940, partial [Borealophlyctis nickersoniae]
MRCSHGLEYGWCRQEECLLEHRELKGKGRVEQTPSNHPSNGDPVQTSNSPAATTQTQAPTTATSTPAEQLKHDEAYARYLAAQPDTADIDAGRKRGATSPPTRDDKHDPAVGETYSVTDRDESEESDVGGEGGSTGRVQPKRELSIGATATRTVASSRKSKTKKPLKSATPKIRSRVIRSPTPVLEKPILRKCSTQKAANTIDPRVTRARTPTLDGRNPRPRNVIPGPCQSNTSRKPALTSAEAKECTTDDDAFASHPPPTARRSCREVDVPVHNRSAAGTSKKPRIAQSADKDAAPKSTPISVPISASKHAIVRHAGNKLAKGRPRGGSAGGSKMNAARKPSSSGDTTQRTTVEGGFSTPHHTNGNSTEDDLLCCPLTSSPLLMAEEERIVGIASSTDGGGLVGPLVLEGFNEFGECGLQSSRTRGKKSLKGCLLKGRGHNERSDLRRLIHEKVTGRSAKRRKTKHNESRPSNSNPLPAPSSDKLAGAPDTPKKRSKFALKVSFRETIKGGEFGGIVAEAVERWNRITYEGLKLLSLYTIQQRKEYPPFAGPDGDAIIKQCFYAVSTIGEKLEPSPPANERLRKAFETYKNARPPGLEWTSRRGLNQSLQVAATNTLCDIRRHVVVHLVKRITAYASIYITRALEAATDFNQQLEKSVIQKMASRLTARLVYNEKRAYALAKARGEEPPPIPSWVQPGTVKEILRLPEVPSEKTCKYDRELLSLLSLHPAIPRAIELVFTRITHQIAPQGGLPICNSKAADRSNQRGASNMWMRYYYGIHYRMLKDIEEWNRSPAEVSQTEPRAVKPAPRVYYSWARREVDRICTEHKQEYRISRRGKRRAALALLTAANQGKELNGRIIHGKSRGKQKKHNRGGRIPAEILVRLRDWAQAVRMELQKGSFVPVNGSYPTGPNRSRLWTLLPQPSLTPHHMPVDTATLVELYALVDTTRSSELRKMALADRRIVWTEAFHLHRVKGVRFPDLESWFPKRQSPRDFSYYMETDGTACSFICNRKAQGKHEPPRPTTVVFDEETVFVAIDPGETDVISGYAPKLSFSDEGGVGATSPATMPIFMRDFDAESIERDYVDRKQQRWARAKAGKESTFSLSGREWRHRAGETAVDNKRDMRTRKMKEDNIDIPAITSSITTGKTVNIEVYFEHLRTTLNHITTLRRFHCIEANWKFYKYRRSQKALVEMVRRVKGRGNESLPKSKIVVAFGNAKFATGGRKGSRRGPVEKFKKYLARHVTLVLVDEYRTPKVCSKCGIDYGSKVEMAEDDDPDEVTACVASTVEFGGGVGEEEDVLGDMDS